MTRVTITAQITRKPKPPSGDKALSSYYQRAPNGDDASLIGRVRDWLDTQPGKVRASLRDYLNQRADADDAEA